MRRADAVEVAALHDHTSTPTVVSTNTSVPTVVSTNTSVPKMEKTKWWDGMDELIAEEKKKKKDKEAMYQRQFGSAPRHQSIIKSYNLTNP